MSSPASLTSKQQQTKQEKKLMDEKIAKVKEVVRNVSANDIILALHNFDLDVGKTIHAFCEGGTQSALGDWEQTGGVSSKKRPQKKRKPAAVQPPSEQSTAKSSINGSEKGMAVKVPTLMPYSSSNGYSNGYFPSSTSISTLNANGSHRVQLNGVGPGHNPPNLTNGGQTCPATKHASNQSPLPTTPLPQIDWEKMDVEAKKKAITHEATDGLARYAGELEKMERGFEKELSVAENNLIGCFKELRKCLSEREHQLREELSQCHHNGQRAFPARRSQLSHLQKWANTLGENDQNEWIQEWKRFNAGRSEDYQLSHASQLLRIDQFAQLANSIGQFGRVIVDKAHVSTVNNVNSTPPSDADQYSVKHSTSHSSLVSGDSVANSGIAHTTGAELINPQKANPVASVVSSSGIVMQSDALSSDQLADLQRQIEETLKSQGIDPSVLSGLGMNPVAPRRRHPPPNQHHHQSGGNNSHHANHSNNSNGGPVRRGDGSGHQKKPAANVSGGDVGGGSRFKNRNKEGKVSNPQKQ